MKNISKIISTLFVALGLSVLTTGCSTHIPVQKEVGILNLKNNEFKKDEQVENVIAIVSPVFAENG